MLLLVPFVENFWFAAFVPPTASLQMTRFTWYYYYQGIAGTDDTNDDLVQRSL